MANNKKKLSVISKYVAEHEKAPKHDNLREKSAKKLELSVP